MGWLLPTTYLEWKEPKKVRSALEQLDWGRCPWWLRRPMWVGALTALMLTNWGLGRLSARFHPEAHPPSFLSFLLVALGGSLTIVYVVPWLLAPLARITKPGVRLTDKGLMLSGTSNTVFRYGDIDNCEIASVDNDGEAVHLLAFRFRKRGVRVVGIDPAVCQSNLYRLLSEAGVGIRVVKGERLDGYISDYRRRCREAAAV